MVKKIKSEKNKTKDEIHNKTKENIESKNDNINTTKTKETVLHKNIKEKRDFAKAQKAKDKNTKQKRASGAS